MVQFGLLALQDNSFTSILFLQAESLKNDSVHFNTQLFFFARPKILGVFVAKLCRKIDEIFQRAYRVIYKI